MALRNLFKKAHVGKDYSRIGKDYSHIYFIIILLLVVAVKILSSLRVL